MHTKFFGSPHLYDGPVNVRFEDLRIGTQMIEAEPMLFSASLGFAYKHGGDLTAEILNRLEPVRVRPPAGRQPIIDTRVHMLMPGMYPAIPGWHCDDVPRTERLGGQPDLLQADGSTMHYTCTLCTDRDSARTVFLKDDVVLETPAVSKHVWKDVHDAIEAKSCPTIEIPHGRIAAFSQIHPHKAPRTTVPCWRFFFRLSYMRGFPQNKIRNQVQVYTSVGGGW